jgi:predicted nucleic acid-binding protein
VQSGRQQQEPTEVTQGRLYATLERRRNLCRLWRGGCQLNGIDHAQTEIQRYQTTAISIITWMEIMIGTTDQDAPVVKKWLSQTFRLIGIDNDIAAHAINIQRAQGIKLPDAIILASAQVQSLLLVTRNTRDFSKDVNLPDVRIPYHLHS